MCTHPAVLDIEITFYLGSNICFSKAAMAGTIKLKMLEKWFSTVARRGSPCFPTRWCTVSVSNSVQAALYGKFCGRQMSRRVPTLIGFHIWHPLGFPGLCRSSTYGHAETAEM
jgi:hypothetical protein